MKKDEFVDATVKPTGFTPTVFMRCRAQDLFLGCARRIAALGQTFFAPGSALASVQIGQICNNAAQIATADSGVPRSVLRSIDKFPDPLEDARYAASFLTKLHKDTNDSSKAAGAYHSSSPELTQKHRTRFDDTVQKLDTGTVAPTLGKMEMRNRGNEIKPVRINRYPQLQQLLRDTFRQYLIPFSQMRDNPISLKVRGALIVLDVGHEGLQP